MKVYVLKHYVLHEGSEIVGIYSSVDKIPQFPDSDTEWYSYDEFTVDEIGE